MLKRVNDLEKTKQARIRKRIETGTLTKYIVDEYLCFDDDELDNWKPKKCGRPFKTDKER